MMLVNLETWVLVNNLAIPSHLTCAKSLPWSLFLKSKMRIIKCTLLWVFLLMAKELTVMGSLDKPKGICKIKATFPHVLFKNHLCNQQRCLNVTIGNTKRYTTEFLEGFFNSLSLGFSWEKSFLVICEKLTFYSEPPNLEKNQSRN